MAPAKKDSKEATIAAPPFLRRGETMPVKIVALRQEGFKGAIDLTLEGLPAGISVAHNRIEASSNSTHLFLSASDNAPGWNGSFNIVGRAPETSAMARTARVTTLLWNSGDVAVEPSQTRFTRNCALAMSGDEPAPIIITAVGTNFFESCVAAKLEIPLKITRTGDFNSALKLKALGVPGLEAMKELAIDGKVTNSNAQIDLAKARPGEYDLIFETEAPGKYQPADLAKKKDAPKPKEVTIVAYSRPVRLKIVAMPIIVTENANTNSAHPGEKFDLPIAIKRLYGFTNAVQFSLSSPDQLKGLKPATVSVPKEKGEGTLQFETPTNAVPGTYQFNLQAEVKFNDQTLKLDRKVPIRIAAVETAKAP
jgi:hypothetical protein